MKLNLIKHCIRIRFRSVYLMYSIHFFVIAVTYFGPGTVDTIKIHLNAVESKAVILVSTDHLIDSLL